MKIATYKYNRIPDIEHTVNVNSIGKIRTVFFLTIIIIIVVKSCMADGRTLQQRTDMLI